MNKEIKNRFPIISPSILSADFSRLSEEILKIENSEAEFIHFDVMDGHFVPPITFGDKLIKDLRPFSKKIFDVHLMVSNPDHHIEHFINAGADIITIHSEASIHLDRSIELIKQYGAKVGVSLNPTTSPSILEYIIDKLDLVLIMTVNPGFAGQKFIDSGLKKIEKIKNMIMSKGLNTLLSVDGGVSDSTAPKILSAGANVLVSGSYLFNGNLAENVLKLKNYAN